jgi:hypothetical protein
VQPAQGNPKGGLCALSATLLPGSRDFCLSSSCWTITVTTQSTLKSKKVQPVPFFPDAHAYKNPTVFTCLSMLRQKLSHGNIYTYASTCPSTCKAKRQPKKLEITQQPWPRAKA